VAARTGSTTDPKVDTMTDESTIGAWLGGCLFVAGFHFFYQRGV
jgi:hypothetical protein